MKPIVSAPLTSSPWSGSTLEQFRGSVQFRHLPNRRFSFVPLRLTVILSRDRPCCYHETPLCLNSILLRIAPARPLWPG